MRPVANGQRKKAALDALGEYQKQGATIDNLKDLAYQLADESDRGLVVILGSFLEDILLERLLRGFSHLTKAEKKNLTRAGGLLNNFDDKINFAHMMGILPEFLLEKLRMVKAMRNACAHSRREISFSTPELRAVLGVILTSEDHDGDFTVGLDALTLRLSFLNLFLFLLSAITGESSKDSRMETQAFLDITVDEVERDLSILQALRERRKIRRGQRLPPSPTD